MDGVEKGTTKANAAFRITTTIGEHYVEAERLGTGISQNKGEIVQLEAGKQKIIKLEFADLTPAVDGNALPVAELNFALPGLMEVSAWNAENENKAYPYPEYYYAFEKGDEIILDLTMSNKKGTNVIHVSTYPDGVERYTNQAFTELTDLRIKVPERSIYRFAFTTNHAFARNAFLKVARKPASSETLNFNTKVTYKRTLTPVSVLEPQSFFINSGSKAFFNGKSRITVPVNLPANTVEWFYRFSASREASDIENVKNNFGLFGEVTKLLFNLTGVGAAINTLAIDKLSQPPGANYCDIYFLEHQYIGLFEAKTDDQWRYLTEGSRENFKAGNVKVTCCNSGTYYLGIKNPDSTYGINVLVEVVALVGSDGYVMESK
ncbi:MAG TPA: hypothetical protein DHV26_03110 [Cytophagales bacterium]|nr:hypothetical protein [Cytophagales bacterium]